MDQSPFPSAYRTAAILAAFSRASDAVACGRSPPPAHAKAPREALFRRLKRSVVRCFRRGGPTEASEMLRAREAAALPTTEATPDETRPARSPNRGATLASHFDLCDTSRPAAPSRDKAA
jgi:hypothetical protein